MTPSALRLRATLLTIALAPAAHAGDVSGAYIGPGAYAGLQAGGGGPYVYGGELSVMAWTEKRPVAGVWGQYGRVVGGDHAHTRVALGVQWAPVVFAGLELGGARLLLDDGRRGTKLALAPYASVGIFVVSMRVGIPLDETARDVGADLGLIATLKLPIPVFDPGPKFGGAGHGRPFASQAPLAGREDWG